MKNVKWGKLAFFAIFLSFILIVAACSNNDSSSESSSTGGNSDSGNSNSEHETIKLKVANYAADTSPMYYAFVKPWMEKVTEYTDGQVQFDYFPSGQLGQAGDLLNLTKMGTTDIAVIVPDYTADQMPLISFLSNYPGVGESVHQRTYGLNKLLQENDHVIETDYLSNGVYPIMGFVPPGDDLWMIDKEIRVPEDLKGLKVRTVGGTINELYEHLGATPISIAFAELYEALERNVVNGAATYAMALKNGGFGHLVSYTTPLQMGHIIHTLGINEKVWNNLPGEVQEAMKKAADEVTEVLGDVYVQETDEFMEEFLGHGTIVELTAEENQKWQDAFSEWGQAWLDANSDKGIPYEEVLNAYKEYLDEY